MSDKKLFEMNEDALDQVAGGAAPYEATCTGTYKCSQCGQTKTGQFTYSVVVGRIVYYCSDCKPIGGTVAAVTERI